MASVWVLVVGGGQAGGDTGGGGGNAGQLNENTALAITAGAKTVTVGNGGTAPVQNSGDNGGAGTSSVFESITSTGGTSFNGSSTGAGGDGAGGTGAAGPGGNGGAGVSKSISGSALFYAGGGGGSNSAAPGGTGGSGVGGVGGIEGGTPASAPTANTGSGGGGAWFNQTASNGAAGVVIIAYKTDGSDGVYPSSTGGTVTTSGLYTIHTFTSSGTFTVSTTPPASIVAPIMWMAA
jgi:hypothetical protein